MYDNLYEVLNPSKKFWFNFYTIEVLQGEKHFQTSIRFEIKKKIETKFDYVENKLLVA